MYINIVVVLVMVPDCELDMPVRGRTAEIRDAYVAPASPLDNKLI